MGTALADEASVDILSCRVSFWVNMEAGQQPEGI